jgi:hypothetical protein
MSLPRSGLVIWASVSAISFGINILTHSRDPHEITEYLGAYLLVTGIAAIVTWLAVVWNDAGRPLPGRLAVLALLPTYAKMRWTWRKDRGQS